MEVTFFPMVTLFSFVHPLNAPGRNSGYFIGDACNRDGGRDQGFCRLFVRHPAVLHRLAPAYDLVGVLRPRLCQHGSRCRRRRWIPCTGAAA